jgi:Ca2+/Na+ antiporter
MVKELVQSVTGFLNKDYLFGSVLSALFFLLAVGATLASVIGWTATREIIGEWEILGDSSAAAVLCVIVFVLFSYLLNVLRPLFLGLWTGTTNVLLLKPFYNLSRFFEKKKYEKLRGQIPTAPSSGWGDTLDQFNKKILDRWTSGTGGVTQAQVDSLSKLADLLELGMPESKKQNLLDEIIDAYDRYRGGSLEKAYIAFSGRLRELDETEQGRQRLALANLDRRFGKYEAMAPTELGNVIQAYNDYPFERYCIEGEVFWPRLQETIPAQTRQQIQDHQTYLDFSITTATLAALYAILVLVGGPWIWDNRELWIALATAGALTGYLFYRTGCLVAWRLGDFIRASFDLARLDLLKVLGGGAPSTLKEERARWRDLSTLLVYGGDFTELKDVPLYPREPVA